MSNKDGVCMKAEWQNYSIFKPKHTTFLTLREISSKLFPVCWQFMKRNGFFSFRYSFKKESTSFLCILATFLSRKFGRLFLLDKRLKTSSHFLKLLMQKFFFCGKASPHLIYVYLCIQLIRHSIYCERNGYKLSTKRSFGCLEYHRPIKS